MYYLKQYAMFMLCLFHEIISRSEQNWVLTLNAVSMTEMLRNAQPYTYIYSIKKF